ncbi:MAG TPA: YfhO family protein, partial [Thermoanaerobaculia bacterium]|nr:YfhO family protein [Thermoanaerobaculia bacterium]
MKSRIRTNESRWPSAAGFLLLVCFILYWPVVGGKIPIPSGIVLQFAALQSAERAPEVDPTAEMGDLITQVYPWRSLASQTVRSGAIPLWNFHTMLGAPLAANHQSAVFYPFNFTYYVLPVPYAWALGFVMRFLMASGFCAWYARSLGVSLPGSLVSGVVFATCGSMTAWNGWTMVDSALWLPLGLLAVDRLRVRSGPGEFVLAAVAFSMPVLAGHPEMALFVTVTTVLYAAFRLPFPLAEDASGKLRFIRDFGLTSALAVALAAVQIFPTIEWLGNLERDVGAAAHWGSRPLHEMTALFSRDARSNPNSAGILIPEGAAYAGMLAIMLAFLSPLLIERKRELVFFGLLLLVTLQVSYGWGPFYPLVTSLPVFESIPNWRMVLIANFCIAILAGFGLTVFQRQLKRGWRAPAFWSLLISGGVVCSIGVAVLMRQTTGPSPGGAAWKAALTPTWSLILVAVAVIALLPAGGISVKTRGAIVLLALTLEMTTFAFGHVPYVESKTVFPEPLLYKWLKETDQSTYRLAAFDGTTPSNLEMIFGIDSPVGYDFATRRTSAILAPLRPAHASGHVAAELFPSIDPALLDLMNVKYIFSNEWVERRQPSNALPGVDLLKSDGPAHLFRRASALER